ncbi:MAG: aminopeptidase N [Acidobacteria bacterium]|nr:aminopeptidase N [Acidobacteriota bacterium]
MRLTLLLLICTGLFGQDNQTQTFANERSQTVGQPNYQLFFAFEPGQENYTGSSQIDLELLHTTPELIIDFSGKSVDQVFWDDQALSDFRFSAENGVIHIPIPSSPTGSHQLKIVYTGTFSRNGAGLHRFVDPQDGLEYLYTDFEPQDAHRAFPCFDQPDLKATYQVTVDSPHDWVVVSNTPEISNIRQEGNTRRQFAKTLPFSTYLFQLTAGPYASWHDANFRYPLGIYCRQSLASYMDPEVIFETTRKGFDFFDNYFQSPYPFGKYDQLFVPEFNSGAMENVGAVTFNESYVFRNTPALDRIRRRDATILHEMAHMWFGDLVTMRWWNDLWLNESFASNMSSRAMTALGLTEFEASQITGGSYIFKADQNPSSHPILADVPDIQTAASIFDSITYGKGERVLYQLAFYLGEDVFRDGVRYYLKTHAYQNATFQDFIGSLETVSKKSLEGWRKAWLETRDVNALHIEFAIKDGKIANAAAIQTPGVFDPTLRPHACEIGLYDVDKQGHLVLRESVRIAYDGANTALSALNGKPAPTVLIPNFNDRDYVKSFLDPQSLLWVQNHLAQIKDANTQAILWRILNDMVWEMKLDPKTFLDLAWKNLLLQETFSDCQAMSSHFWSGNSYLKRAERKTFSRQIWPEIDVRLKQQEPGSDLQQFWYRLWLSTASELESLTPLKDLYTGTTHFEGLEMNADRKWEILESLVERGDKEALEWAKNLSNEDKSQSGQLNALAIPYTVPDPNKKAEVWQKVLSDTSLSLYEKRALSGTFFNYDHPEWYGDYISQYFLVLQSEAFQEMPWHVASRWAQYFFPSICEGQTVEATEAFLKNKAVSGPLYKELQSRLFYLKRYLAIKNQEPHGT